MNYTFCGRGIADMSMRQTGAGVHRNTTWLRIKTIYLLSSWVVAGTIIIVLGVERVEQGGLLCCGCMWRMLYPRFKRSCRQQAVMMCNLVVTGCVIGCF